MRRYDIVSGILPILSIIDFTLAAPILVQEKCQAGVGVVHIPEGVTTALGKRMNEELDKEVGEYVWGKAFGSSDKHASSSSAPGSSGLNQGPTDVVQASAPNTASSTTHPSLLMEPSSPPSKVSPVHEVGGSQQAAYDDRLHWPQYNPGSSEIEEVQDHGLAKTQTPPKESPRPSTDLPDHTFDWEYWQKQEDPPPPPPPPKSKVSKVKSKLSNWLDSLAPVPPPRTASSITPNPNSRPPTAQDPNNIDWDFWANHGIPRPPPPTSKLEKVQSKVQNWLSGLVDPPPKGPKPGSSITSDPKPPDAGPSNLGARTPRQTRKLDGHSDLMTPLQVPPSVEFRPPETEPPNEPKSGTGVVPGQPRAPELTDPEVNSAESARDSSRASSQQADFQADIYAAKGKK